MCDICGGHDGHYYDWLICLFPSPSPYYDESTFVCELNKSNKVKDADWKCNDDLLLEKNNEVELQIQRHDETIHNLKCQVRKLLEAFNVQQANILDSRQEEREFEEELEESVLEFRVEY